MGKREGKVSMRTYPVPRYRKGYTLVELLAVIVIIGFFFTLHFLPLRP